MPYNTFTVIMKQKKEKYNQSVKIKRIHSQVCLYSNKLSKVFIRVYLNKEYFEIEFEFEYILYLLYMTILKRRIALYRKTFLTY